MDFTDLHSWDLTPAEALRLQRILSGRVDSATPLGPCTTIAAADVSFNRYDPWLYAVVVMFEYPSMVVLEKVGVAERARFPYVPGLLSFREAPPILEAFRRLNRAPDVVLCDGQGVAHPRRLGIASHLGLWLGLPTIGCAKSRLCGAYDEPGLEKGDLSPLIDEGETIGAVVRTRARVKPLFVSAGHLCTLDDAVSLVLANTTRHRLPVAARRAHHEVNQLRRDDQTRESAE